jgi:glycosyltransferase involved in cell wall biosynthesis
MRVLQAIAGAPNGGAERFFERLVPALHRAGVAQRVLIRKDERRRRQLQEAGVAELAELPFGNRFDLVTRLGFRRQVRNFAPDIVFTWMSRASLMAPKSPLAGRRFVRVARLGGYYDLKYYQNCHYLIGDTQDIVDYMVHAGWPAEKATYLPNFVSDRQGKPIPRSEFSIPEGAPVLLALGRLHTNKGFDVLLKALGQLPGAYLLLAGAGPEEKALHDLATALGVKPRVRFLGWRDDIADLFATADLFVHPARHEPLGNVIIEAWAARAPIVCTAAKGPSVLIEDGVSGLLVPVDQPVALAQSIASLLVHADRAKGLAEAGRRVYEREYTEAAVVARYLAFFQRITA